VDGLHCSKTDGACARLKELSAVQKAGYEEAQRHAVLSAREAAQRYESTGFPDIAQSFRMFAEALEAQMGKSQ